MWYQQLETFNYVVPTIRNI